MSTDVRPGGFCTHCRFEVATFDGLAGCPNCGTKSVPCAWTNQVSVTVNWHELHLLCCWAERWGQDMAARGEEGGGAGAVYAIAQALQAQHPSRHPLTLAGEVNELKRTHPGTKLVDGAGDEVQT